MSAPALPTADEIRAALKPLDFFVRYAHGSREGEVYVDAHAQRFRETLIELQDLPRGAAVLELGAVPYYMTVLLDRVLGFAVTPVSFYEVDRAAVDVHHVRNAGTGETFDFPYRALNVERDLFPFADGSFDAVLCCEILEHLLINPGHTFYEAHRVLKPGGALLVSTPNVARWENVLKLAAGRNIYDHYHGNGIYGRHNREYTLAEVCRLAEACGFEIARAGTRDVYDSPFAPGRRQDGEHRDDTIFVLARASGRARAACPDELYVLVEEYRNVIRPGIRMGIDDVGHLGLGWHEVERDEQRGCRWTGAEADCALRAGATATGVAIELCAHHPDLPQHPVRVAVSRGDAALGVVELSVHGWQVHRLPLGATAGEIVDLRLRPDRTWSPRGAGLADDRDLGIRVSAVWLE